MRDLLGRDDDVAVAIAARHVRRFPAADRPRLREIAIARLARREWHRDGMVTARLLAHVAPERLRERGLRAGEGPELLVRLHCEPDATIAAWATTFREEPAQQLNALTVLSEAAAAGRMDGMEIASDVWTRLRAELIAAELDEVAVEFALHELPALRCKELCARHLETLSATTLGGDRADALDALELFDATALRDRLRGFLGNDDERVRHFAAWALLKLGDPESGVSMPEALATAEATGWEWWGQQSSPVLLAALSARVGEQVPAGHDSRRFGPLMALASARGLPARWCDRWAEDLDGLEDPAEQQAWWTRLRGHLLAGDVDAAVTAWLRHDPAVGLEGVGSLRLPLATEILRQRRECGPYRRWAVEELAVAGDASALAEIDAAIAAAQYDWIERMRPDVLVPRRRSDRVAALVELLESNRAMVEVVRPLLDAMTRDRPFDIPATELQTRAENGRRWFWQFGGRLRWSTITGTFAIAPQ
ncbi:MAG: hypothetical protein IPK26_05415 [Planctomycetes bacterium]|nr:hypothetical protein [Planctomycetota bacterium]